MLHSRFSFVLALAATLLCAACTSSQQTYVAHHPELSPEQKKMIVLGKITDQAAVAGMTREQICLAMGGEPSQLTKINGEDAWVWLKSKPPELADFREPDRTNTGSGNMSRPQQFMDEPEPAARPKMRTTVFFDGDKATHVDVTEEHP